MRHHPDAAQGRVDRLPLLALRRELRPSVLGEAVVLAPASGVGLAPLGGDKPLALEPVQYRVEHPVGPLQVAAREITDALDDRVTVAVSFGQDREHEGGGGGSDEVLTEFHT